MADTELATREPEEQQRVAAPVAGPGGAFEALRREIDRIFDDFRPTAWGMPFRRALSAAGLPWPELDAGRMAPAMDLTEHDTAWELTVELPGLEEKDIELRVTDGMLTIRGEKREETERKDRQVHLCERRYGAFQRSMSLPSGIDRARIDASFANGVLKVTLPKSAEARASERRIEIRKG